MRRYGVWAGDPIGRREDPTLCIAATYNGLPNISHQCQRLRKVGPGKNYCKQHNAILNECGDVGVPKNKRKARTA